MSLRQLSADIDVDITVRGAHYPAIELIEPCLTVAVEEMRET